MAIPTDGKISVVNRSQITRRIGDHTLLPGVPTAVPIEYVSLYAGDGALWFDFSSLSDHLADRTEDGRPMFDFWCPLSMVDGYGRHAIDLWRGFGWLGAEAVLRPSAIIDRSHIPQELIAQRDQNMHRPPSRVSLCFSVPYDPAHLSTQSVTRISMTQFETDHVPAKHIAAINLAHHLIVTSSFQPKVWRGSGLREDMPISVMTPGIDTDFFAYRERESTGTFKVLLLGALSGRKNADGAVQIFQEASMGNPDWRLTIKSRSQLGQGVREMARGDSRINVVFEDSSPAGVLGYYHAHDCLLWPSKGEGVGLPPLEAMATGMELVCADNSGMRDYLSERVAYPIKTSHKVPASGPGECFDHKYVNEYGDVGSYWMPDHGHAVKQLRRCFNDWLKGKGKGRRAAEHVRARHTLRHQAQSVLRVVEEYL